MSENSDTFQLIIFLWLGSLLGMWFQYGGWFGPLMGLLFWCTTLFIVGRVLYKAIR